MTKKGINSKKEETGVQLSLGLKSPLSNVFFNIKTRIVKRLYLFGANSFINDPFIWFFIVFQIAGTLTLLLYVLNQLSQLPRVVPLFGYTGMNIDILIPNFLYLIFPLFMFFLLVLGMRIGRQAYFKNSTLTYYSLFVILLISLSLILHVIRILSQYV